MAFYASTFAHKTEEQLIQHQRFLVRRMNFMLPENKNLSVEECLMRLKEFDTFTEWLWNRKPS